MNQKLLDGRKDHRLLDDPFILWCLIKVKLGEKKFYWCESCGVWAPDSVQKYTNREKEEKN